MKHALWIVLAALAACSGGEEPQPAGAPAAEGAPAGAALHAAVLSVSAADQEHMALELATLEPATYAPERRTYGRVVRDPSRAAMPRAPLAGTLLAGDVTVAPGAVLEAGAVIYRLSPRWTPQERSDLTSRKIAARADVAALEAEKPGLDRELERARTLNAQEKSVSDRDLEETEMRVRSAEARLAGARELVRALEAVGTPDEAGAMSIVLPSPGTVVEVDVRAGEAVEAGAPLVAVEDFRAPLVSIDLPLDGSVSPDVATARISPGGAPELTLAAERVGVDPAAGTAGLSGAVLFRVAAGQPGVEGLRPGLALLAWLPTGAPEETGLRVPRSAVVRLAGRSFVYVKRGAEAFERRALESAHPVPDGWFLDAAWAGGESLEVVVHGAQNLLSFELLGRHGEEEGE